MFTFMHCVFDLHRFWYALKSAFSALYFPFTLFCFVSSEILETLRSNFLAMNRRLFFTFKYFSIRCRSYKFKCTNSFINSFYRCSDSKVYLQVAGTVEDTVPAHQPIEPLTRSIT